MATGSQLARVLGLTACGLVVACDRAPPAANRETAFDVANHETDTGPPLDVKITTTVTGGAYPTIIGRTNLPEGTHLWVVLKRQPTIYDTRREIDFPVNNIKTMFADALIVVHDGGFVAGPQWETQVPIPIVRNYDEPLGPGSYVFEVTTVDSSFPDQQPPSVNAVFGPKEVNLEGPLINSCCFGEPPEQARHDLVDLDQLREAAGGGRAVYYARYVDVSGPPKFSGPQEEAGHGPS